MKECELCDLPARMYCESDQASLCWNCDSKVHSANFLVARHSRSLLCLVCQSPTPWKASGTNLGPSFSVCEICVNNSNGRLGRGEEEEESDDDDDDDVEDEEIDGEDDQEEDDEFDDDGDGNGNEVDDDEDRENQVVPWTSTPPPPVSTSSSSEASPTRFCGGGEDVAETEIIFPLKRMREDADLGFQRNHSCASSQRNYDATLTTETTRNLAEDEATSVDSLRPFKDRKKTQTESKAVSLVGSLERFQRDVISGDDASAKILGICKISKDPRTVDLISRDSNKRQI